MAKLYELAGEYQKLIGAITETEDGEVTPEMETALANVQGEFTAKAENIAKLIRNIESDEDALRAEAKRLSDRAKACANKSDWLKNYLKDNMRMMSIDKIKGEVLSLAIRPSPPSCKVVDDSKIPDVYIHTERVVDKKAIIDSFKHGGSVPDGVEIITDNLTLIIR